MNLPAAGFAQVVKPSGKVEATAKTCSRTFTQPAPQG